MMSETHVRVARMHHGDLIAEAARERLAAQARQTVAAMSVGVPPRSLLRGGVCVSVRRAIAGLATFVAVLVAR